VVREGVSRSPRLVDREPPRDARAAVRRHRHGHLPLGRADAWEESIDKYLSTVNKVTVGQVAREALHIEVPRLGRAEQNRIVAAMQRLGWKRLSPDISHYLGVSGRRISESCCATTTFWRFEERPDADRV
jgi:hypothetical protein